MVCHCWCPPFSVGHVAFLCICLPGLSLLMSAVTGGVRPFPLACSVSVHVSPRSVAAGVRPFRWPCSMSIHLSPRSVAAGVRPFSMSIHLSPRSVLVSALFRCRCNISIHLSPGLSLAVSAHFRHVALLFMVMWHFYAFVSQVCRCWCPLSLAVSALFRWRVAFLLICLPGLSLLASALFVGHAACLFICLPPGLSLLESALLACLFICRPGLSLVVFALFRWRCNISIHYSPQTGYRGSKCFLRVSALAFCLPPCWSLCPPCLPSVSFCLWSCPPCCWSPCPSCLPPVSFCLPSCWSLCPPCLPSCLPFVSGLVPLLVGHCVRLVSLEFPFFSLLVSLLVGHCVRLPFCLALSPVLSPSCWTLCPSCFPSVSFGLPSFLYMSCNPSHLSPSCSALQFFTFVSQLWAACRLQSCAFVSLCLHLSPSSGVLCQLLPCNPLHLSPSSGLLCPPLPCNPLHLSPSAGLLCPPLPCNPEFYFCLPALTAVAVCLAILYMCPRNPLTNASQL